MNIRKQTAINGILRKGGKRRRTRKEKPGWGAEAEVRVDKKDGKISNENDRNACMCQTWHGVSTEMCVCGWALSRRGGSEVQIKLFYLPLSSSRNSAFNSSSVGSGSFIAVVSVFVLLLFADESPCFMLARTLWPRKTAWILVAACSVFAFLSTKVQIYTCVHRLRCVVIVSHCPSHSWWKPRRVYFAQINKKKKKNKKKIVSQDKKSILPHKA